MARDRKRPEPPAQLPLWSFDDHRVHSVATHSRSFFRANSHDEERCGNMLRATCAGCGDTAQFEAVISARGRRWIGYVAWLREHLPCTAPGRQAPERGD